MPSSVPTSSIRNLLSGLIDYAGLFPPAGLDLASALANFERYRGGEFAWMLGRFIVPASRLSELQGASVPLSVLAGHDLEGDLAHVRDFLQRHPGTIDTIEVSAKTVQSVRDTALLLPSEYTVYFEIPVSANPAALITAISEEGGRAKVRTGGLTQDRFPSAPDLVRFLELCSIARVPFKATAGLHHPILGSHPLTYEQQSPSAVMHGFLNVFLTAAFLKHKLPFDLVSALLEEKSSDAFQFSEQGVHWKNHSLTSDEISRARGDFAIAFGSCSFEDPIADLRAMSLL